MKKIILLCSVFAISSCENQKNNKTHATAENENLTEEVVLEEEQEVPILLGEKSRKELEKAPYGNWFKPNYEEYAVNEEDVDQLKPLLQDVEVKVFMGTWCEDSQRETPHFFKVLDQAYFNFGHLSLITMSRDKDTPEKLEDGLNITNVPTFIFYKDGKEINRIVEYPVTSLEKDMLAILSGEDYKHSYAE